MAEATAKAPERQLTNFENAIMIARKSLVSTLGSQDKADALIVALHNMARRAPDLHRCVVPSVIKCVVEIANLRLNPAVPNEVWMIPRRVKLKDTNNREYWDWEASNQFGYGGLRKLVMRSPDVQDCFAREVRKNDLFRPPRTPIDLPVHILPDAFAPRGLVIGYYAAIQVKGGNWRFWPMSVAEVERHAEMYAQKTKEGNLFPSWSKGKVDGEGLSNFDKMGLKTVLRMGCNPRDVSLEPDAWTALDAEEILMRETAAETQGYDRQGNRPALTMGSGLTMDELLRNLSGDQADVQEELAEARQTKPQTKRQQAKAAEKEAPTGDTTGQQGSSLFDAEESARMDRELAAQGEA